VECSKGPGFLRFVLGNCNHGCRCCSPDHCGLFSGGDVPVLSVPQVLGCSANGTSGSCSGDYPTTAFEYAAESALLNNAVLPGKCHLLSSAQDAPLHHHVRECAVPRLVWPPPHPAEAASSGHSGGRRPFPECVVREPQGWCSRTPAATPATWTTQCSWLATTSQPCSLTGSSETRGETPGAPAATCGWASRAARACAA